MPGAGPRVKRTLRGIGQNGQNFGPLSHFTEQLYVYLIYTESLYELCLKKSLIKYRFKTVNPIQGFSLWLHTGNHFRNF